MMNFWDKDEEDFLCACIEQKWTHREIGLELKRTQKSVEKKAARLKLHNGLIAINLTNNEVDKRLKNRQIKRIDSYIKLNTKINFNCLKCNNIWLATPKNIFNGRGCPNCAKYGFNDSKPATTYCIYFEDLDLYKIGITNNINERLTHFGYATEVVYTKEFALGIDARNLEKEWLENIKDYKINTGLLRSGNTETFKYGN